MIKILKNNTENDVFITDVGITIHGNEAYSIPPMDHLLWEQSVDIVGKILDKTISVFDGNYYLNPRTGLALIHSNHPALSEYYTLTQDDDLLTGNGKILHLHDEDWEIEEDFEEDDIDG